MKPISIRSPRLAAALTLAAACPLHGAAVTLATADAFGNSSLNTAGGWSPAGVPAPGNSYGVAILQLRSPANGDSHTFLGDSLSINTGGSFLYKGAGTAGIITVPNLILNGGKLDHASSFADVFTLDGGLNVAAASIIDARQGPIVIGSTVTGTGALTLPATNNSNAYAVTFNGINTYTGNITVAGNLIQGPAGILAFSIGASGVNNTISGTGTGSAAFNGAFDINLAGAGATVGNSWSLVSAATLNESYGSSFYVLSGATMWTQVAATATWDVWISPTGDYRFDESTGTLLRVAADSDQDGLPNTWEQAKFGSATSFNLGGDDPDLDSCSNYLEYLADTNPNNAASFPDSDTDTLPDGWEYSQFGNLAQLAAGDFDNDFNSNAVEYANGTSAANNFDYPDEESAGTGDGINDGWEIFYFGSIAACLPEDDSDNDLFSNYDEFSAGTNPIVQISSPDTDGDGLPDGWEVKYFRAGGEDLATVIAKQSGPGDPDTDDFNNLLEFGASTDPSDGGSKPATLAYWRFEESTTGVVPYGNDTGGNQPNTVLDASGLGNHMMTWRNYTAPTYATVVPFSPVPLTSSANTASLAFVRDAGNLFLTDNIYTGANVPVNSHVFDAFTIEASFNTSASNVWQVVIGKTGNPIGGQAPFSLKIRASDNKLIAGIVDGSGVAREAVSTRAITTATWYSAAVTASATQLRLWIKSTSDASYVLEAAMAINGPFYTYAGVNAPWVIGLGKWNGADADPFSGNIDEVRITPTVLAPSAFLVPIPDNDLDDDGMDDTWESDHFQGTAQTAAGDYDKDGTSNLAEFLLGLESDDGTSYLAASRTGAALTWKSAVGLSFEVERSTTLGSWDPMATIIGNGPVSNWTDPAPPAGKAFYRVILPE